MQAASTSEGTVEITPEQSAKFRRLQLTPEERNAPAPDIVTQAEESLQGECQSVFSVRAIPEKGFEHQLQDPSASVASL